MTKGIQSQAKKLVHVSNLDHIQTQAEVETELAAATHEVNGITATPLRLHVVAVMRSIASAWPRKPSSRAGNPVKETLEMLALMKDGGLMGNDQQEQDGFGRLIDKAAPLFAAAMQGAP